MVIGAREKRNARIPTLVEGIVLPVSVREKLFADLTKHPRSLDGSRGRFGRSLGSDLGTAQSYLPALRAARLATGSVGIE